MYSYIPIDSNDTAGSLRHIPPVGIHSELFFQAPYTPLPPPLYLQYIYSSSTSTIILYTRKRRRRRRGVGSAQLEDWSQSHVELAATAAELSRPDLSHR